MTAIRNHTDILHREDWHEARDLMSELVRDFINRYIVTPKRWGKTKSLWFINLGSIDIVFYPLRGDPYDVDPNNIRRIKIYLAKDPEKNEPNIPVWDDGMWMERGPWEDYIGQLLDSYISSLDAIESRMQANFAMAQQEFNSKENEKRQKMKEAWGGCHQEANV